MSDETRVALPQNKGDGIKFEQYKSGGEPTRSRSGQGHGPFGACVGVCTVEPTRAVACTMGSRLDRFRRVVVGCSSRTSVSSQKCQKTSNTHLSCHPAAWPQPSLTTNNRTFAAAAFVLFAIELHRHIDMSACRRRVRRGGRGREHTESTGKLVVASVRQSLFACVMGCL